MLHGIIRVGNGVKLHGILSLGNGVKLHGILRLGNEVKLLRSRNKVRLYEVLRHGYSDLGMGKASETWE